MRLVSWVKAKDWIIKRGFLKLLLSAKKSVCVCVCVHVRTYTYVFLYMCECARVSTP